LFDTPLRVVMTASLQADGASRRLPFKLTARHDGVLQADDASQADGASRRPPFKLTARQDGLVQADGAS